MRKHRATIACDKSLAFKDARGKFMNSTQDEVTDINGIWSIQSRDWFL